MPELPEVESLCRMLQARVVGKTVTGVRVELSRIVRTGDLKSLVGGKIVQVRREGKALRFTTDSPAVLWARLGMTGTFLWAGDLKESPSHVRVALCFEDGELVFRDIRTFGGLFVVSNGKIPWAVLGVDPFDGKFGWKALKQAFSGRRVAIKQALMDQKLIAGVGNIYASEALFAARIHPSRPAGSLSEGDLRSLCKELRRILRASINSGGTTFRDFKLSDGRDGAFKSFLKVYGKAGEPCPRCGATLERIIQGQRATYFCTQCQQIPAF